MPLSFTISSAAGVIRVSGSGRASLADNIRMAESLREHPELRPGMSLLLDAREMEPDLFTADLRSSARYFEPLGLRRMAIVAPADYAFGTARAFAVHAEAVGLEVGAFRSVDEALAWVQAPPLPGVR